MREFAVICFLLTLAVVATSCKDPAGIGEGPRIMTDAKGNRYVVQHNIGGTYTVERLEDKPQ